MLIIFHHGNRKDYLLKALHHLQHLIMVALELSYYGTKTRAKFTGSCLKQSKSSYTHGKVVNIYIVYELGASSSHVSDPTLKYSYFN